MENGCGRRVRRGAALWPLLVAALAAGGLLALAPGAAAADHALTIVTPKSLTLTSGASTTVFVRNDGAAVPSMHLTVIPAGKVTVTPSTAAIGATSVEAITFRTKTVTKDATVTGTLVVSAPGVAPGAIALTVGPKPAKKGPPDWLYVVVFATGGGALLLVVGRWIYFLIMTDKPKPRPGTKLGPANWSFSTSWGSNLTVIGAVLGTILTAGVLPDRTSAGTATYAGLNLLFGILVLVAPFVYTATQHAVTVHKPGQEPQYQGTVGWFLVASTVTVWATAGELATTGLLFNEIRTSRSLPEAVVWTMWIAVGAAGALLVVYTWTTIGAILADQSDLGKHKARARRRHAVAHAIELPVDRISNLTEDDVAHLRGIGGRIVLRAPTPEELPPDDELSPELPHWSLL